MKTLVKFLIILLLVVYVFKNVARPVPYYGKKEKIEIANPKTQKK